MKALNTARTRISEAVKALRGHETAMERALKHDAFDLDGKVQRLARDKKKIQDKATELQLELFSIQREAENDKRELRAERDFYKRRAEHFEAEYNNKQPWRW